MLPDIIKTPLYRSADGVYLKCENLQLYGSYKVRGVRPVLQSLKKKSLAEGLVTISAGNMARSIAEEARHFQTRLKAYVPKTTPTYKLAHLMRLGCTIVKKEFAEIWRMVQKAKTPDDLFLIHPQLSVLKKGYGSLGEEILSQQSGINAVVIPFGCGGLFLGVAQAIKHINPDIKLIAAESNHAAPLQLALNSGCVVKIKRRPSMVDAIGTPSVISGYLDEFKILVDEVIVVTQEQISFAMKDLLHIEGQKVEGAAAVSYAASRLHQDKNSSQKIVAILSGGNVQLRGHPTKPKLLKY